MAAEHIILSRAAAMYLKWQSSSTSKLTDKHHAKLFQVRSSWSADDDNNTFKQLGLSSLRKEIEDAVLRAEISARTALDFEEARRIKREQMMLECDLWDDLVLSNEILGSLADSAKAVDALKDLKYKAEEAKLISELADVEGMNYRLFKQAYNASLDVNKILDQYEMVRLLKGPYDSEGACVIIKAGSESPKAEMWAKDLFDMYAKWAKKLGYEWRLVEKHPSMSGYGGIKLTTVELEFACAYGYLSGERGIHSMISSQNGPANNEVISACVDVVPLFLGTVFNLQINNEDLIISAPSLGDDNSAMEPAVCIEHIPTGITVQSSGERNYFANKLKALNRLKAKLLVIAEEQKISDINSIRRDVVLDACRVETRRYVVHPDKLVHDVKTSIQLPDLNSILDGNIEPLIGAHIKRRYIN